MTIDLSVYCLAGDIDGGCGFYRIREPARIAKEIGVDVSVHTEIPVEATTSGGKYVIESLGIKPDVIVIQRPLLGAWFELIKYAQSLGIACVVEIDDDLKVVHRQNVAFRDLDPTFSPTSNWKWLVACCDIADLVITSTDNLARRYAPHGRFKVLRNAIPASEFDRPVTYNSELRVGWSGTVQTHPVDLDVAGAHISSALFSYSADPNFYVVGDGEFVREKLYLNENSEVIPTGWVPRETYMETLSAHMDVGVVPLNIDEFNTSKSYLKMLEMSSQGIPTVASPTYENTLLSKITGSPLAVKPKDWQKHLKLLLTDRDFFLERSHNVRESVRHLTYENTGHHWVEAWVDALSNRRGFGS